MGKVKPVKVINSFGVIFETFLKIFRKIIARIFQNVGATTRIEIQSENINTTVLRSEISMFSDRSKIFEMVKIWA